MDGKEFKKIRVEHLKLSAAALGHALGYEGSDANIARTVYRLEAGRRPIPRPIGRLLECSNSPASRGPRSVSSRQIVDKP
jgi:hypothetical protein